MPPVTRNLDMTTCRGCGFLFQMKNNWIYFLFVSLITLQSKNTALRYSCPSNLTQPVENITLINILQSLYNLNWHFKTSCFQGLHFLQYAFFPFPVLKIVPWKLFLKLSRYLCQKRKMQNHSSSLWLLYKKCKQRHNLVVTSRVFEWSIVFFSHWSKKFS